jgi:hypothetical protein
LSWDGGEVSTQVDVQDHSVKARKPTPPPQVDAVVEQVIVETTMVEDMCSCHHW